MAKPKNKPWTDEDNEDLRRMWQERLSIQEISTVTGRSISAINNQRIRLKMPTRNYRSDAGKEKVEENSVRVYLPWSYMEELERRSKRTGRSKSSIVRDLIGTLVPGVA